MRVILIIPKAKQAQAKSLLPDGGWNVPIKNKGKLYGYICSWNTEDPFGVIDIVVGLGGRAFLLEWEAKGYVTATSVYGKEPTSVINLHNPRLSNE